MYRLIALNGPRKGERVTVPVEPLTIGRDKGCGLVLDDPDAALRHAVVEPRADGVFIRDLGSMSRILVNKREVREAQIRHGDVIEIGRSLFLVQVVLQAEVGERAAASARRRRQAVFRAAAWAAVILGGSLLAARMLDHRGSARPAKKASAVPTTELAAAVVPMPSLALTNVVSVTNEVPPEEVARELKRLHEELALVKDAVKGSAWTAQVAYVSATRAATSMVARATGANTASVAAAQADDARRRASESALAEARAAVRGGRGAEADRMLTALQTSDPGFLPAYEEHAALFERQGQLDKAIGQWALLLQRSSATPIAGRAAGEWSRLTGEQRRNSTAQAHRIKIASLTQMRFPESRDYDEMRVVRIEIEAIGASRPDPATVKIEVSFFDHDSTSGAVSLTRAMAPRVEPRLPGPWPDEGPHAVTAAYVVPPGHRAKPGNGTQQFHGYVVRVFVDGVLQDEDARPTDLLKQAAAKASVPAAVARGGARR